MTVLVLVLGPFRMDLEKPVSFLGQVPPLMFVLWVSVYNSDQSVNGIDLKRVNGRCLDLFCVLNE